MTNCRIINYIIANKLALTLFRLQEKFGAIRLIYLHKTIRFIYLDNVILVYDMCTFVLQLCCAESMQIRSNNVVRSFSQGSAQVKH